MHKRGAGFAMGEAMISLAIVAIVSTQVARLSGANAILRAQSAAKASAANLALELSDWTHRGGLQALGRPASLVLPEPGSAAAPVACHAGDCSAADGARHFWAQWHARLRRAIPDARAVICVDQVPAALPDDWACDAAGTEAVLKLGWPLHSGSVGAVPRLAVALGPWH